MRAVRDVIGPDRPLRADVNGAWTPGTAKRMLDEAAPFDPAYVEQPLELDDLAGHAALRAARASRSRSTRAPTRCRTSATSCVREAADVILLDPHEAGGLWQTVKAGGDLRSPWAFP